MGQLSAHLDRGWDLVGRGDFAGAMVSAEKSLELDEASPEANCLIGYIYQAEGRPEEALEHFRVALELEEGFVDAMLRASEVLISPLGRLEEARALLADALYWLGEDELDERADAMLLQIELHLAAGEGEAARKVATDLPTGPFQEPSLPLAVGRALIEVGEIDRGAPLIQQSLERRATGEAHYYMGLVHESRGALGDAVLSFLHARELDGRAPPVPWSLPREQFERRVQAAMARVAESKEGAPIDGALVVVTERPGAEVVAEGIDPRTSVLVDWSPEAPPRVTRIFVYQRNVERVAVGMLGVEDEIASAIERELEHTPPDPPPGAAVPTEAEPAS